MLRPTPATTVRLASFDLAATDDIARLLGAVSGLPPGRGWTHQLQWSYAAPWLNRRLETPIAACRAGDRRALSALSTPCTRRTWSTC